MQGLVELASRGFTARGPPHFRRAGGGDLQRGEASFALRLIVVRHPKRMSFAARWWKGWVGSSLLEHAPCSLLDRRLVGGAELLPQAVIMTRSAKALADA